MKSGRKFKILSLIMVFAVAACCLCSCETWDSFEYTFLENAEQDADQTIYIGVFEPETGKYSEEGKAEIKGIELANSIYNSVLGYKVELIEVDTKSSSSVAETAIQGLIEMKPVAIIGSTGEATSLIASKYIEKAGIPTITPSATNPLITSNNDYYFRACITESQMGAGMAEYAYSKLGSRRIGIVTKTNDSSVTALMDGFDNKITELDGKKKKSIAFNTTNDFSEVGMNKLIKRIRNKGIDTLIIPQGTETMDKFFTLVEENGLTNLTYIGDKSWQEEDFVEMMKSHKSIKIAFPKDSVIDDESSNMTEEAQRFLIQYHNRYGDGDNPSHYAVLGYDSYLLLMNAIHNAGSIEGKAIKSSLLEIKDLNGASGLFNFDSKGNTERTVTISTIRNGKIKAVYVTKKATEVVEIADQSESEKANSGVEVEKDTASGEAEADAAGQAGEKNGEQATGQATEQ